MADDVFSLFVSEEADKFELFYTKFASLIISDLVIHPLLPLSPKGEMCDVNGGLFGLPRARILQIDNQRRKTDGERDAVRTKTSEYSPILQLEQDPVQILDALLPLYSISQILMAWLLEVAPWAAQLTTPRSSIVYNRQRQAKIRGEILEIVAGENALS